MHAYLATNLDPWLNPWSIVHWLNLVAGHCLIVPALLADIPRPNRIWLAFATLCQFAGGCLQHVVRESSVPDQLVLLAIMVAPAIALVVLALVRPRFEDWIDRTGVWIYVASRLFLIVPLASKFYF